METQVAPRDVIDRIEAHRRETLGARCDAKGCGARAYYFAVVNGTELSYCGHHGTKYEVKLMAAASKVIDLRYSITPMG